MWVSKENIRRFLRRVNEELKTTVILTTHDLGDIEQLCRRVIVIGPGKDSVRRGSRRLEEVHRRHRGGCASRFAAKTGASSWPAPTNGVPIEWKRSPGTL
jgi:ABC-2 type transport system ATP-binding protein